MAAFPPKNSTHHGFTMIEMSVVLVIVGLLIAGVIAGQALIRQAQIRNVIADFNGYTTGIRAFDLEYRAFPGDMSYAVTYWPDSQNGDGNGRVEVGSVHEPILAWQHLNRAGISPHGSTGTLESGAYAPRINIPPAINAGGYGFSEATPYGGMRAHYLNAGRPSADTLLGGVLSSEDARSLDAKIDDELADTGKVLATNGVSGGGFVTGCVTSNTARPSEYTLDSEGLPCVLWYKATDN